MLYHLAALESGTNNYDLSPKTLQPLRFGDRFTSAVVAPDLLLLLLPPLIVIWFELCCNLRCANFGTSRIWVARWANGVAKTSEGLHLARWGHIKPRTAVVEGFRVPEQVREFILV